MEFKSILFEKEAGIGIITLNRPKAMNAINDVLLQDIMQAMDLVAKDDEIKAVILTGGDKVFAAGGDIKLMSTATPLMAEAFIAVCHQAFNIIANCEKPVIAAVSGLALGGGCELTLACDLRIAAQGAIFGLPEIKLGIMPGAGGTTRMQRVVGTSWGKYLVMTGDFIDAETALKIGLITHLVSPEELMTTAKKLAAKLARRPALALKAAKKSIDFGLSVDLSAALDWEQKTFALLFASEDQKEGMKAFMEKRAAEFKGI